MNIPIIVVLSDTPHIEELLGFMPSFIDENDKRPAKEQINERYAHGGGWHTFHGFTMTTDCQLKYPGDPAMKPLACMQLRDETIFFYPYAWVAIVQKGGSFEVARLD